MAVVEAKGEVIADADWVEAKGGKVWRGVKENGPTWEN